MGDPLVSIVTAAYNEEEYIESHIQSIIEQTYSNIEHVVVDDGSTDDTASILREYEDIYNLRIFEEPNEGQPDAMNKGFTNSRGELIFWLNADDIFLFPETMKRIVDEFQENPSADVIYGDRAIINDNNQLRAFKMNTPFFSCRRLLKGCFAAFNFFRRDVIEKHKLDTEFDYAPDYEFFLRLAYDDYNFHYLNEVLYCYRWHQDTLSIGNREAQKQEAIRIRDRFNPDNKDDLPLLHRRKEIASSIFEGLYGLYGLKYAYDVQLGYQNVTSPVEIRSPFKIALRSGPIELWPFS